MSTKVCINCKVYQLKWAFIGKWTGLMEVVFFFFFAKNTYILGQSTNCCEPKPTCMHSVILSHGHPLS